VPVGQLMSDRPIRMRFSRKCSNVSFQHALSTVGVFDQSGSVDTSQTSFSLSSVPSILYNSTAGSGAGPDCWFFTALP
jgi:hypothetical protein